jgi:hypothetical protein
MDGETKRGVLYLKCPKCGRKIKADDWSEYDDEVEYSDEESLSIYDVALNWASKGKDEDYTCGYTEEELEDVL